MIARRGKLCSLPRDWVGMRFVNLFTTEIEIFTAAQQSSEWELLFTYLILKHDKMVKKVRDIRSMLMWCMSGHMGEKKHQKLLQEAER